MLTQQKKRIALVAHDHKKQELITWAKKHIKFLERHTLIGTGTTGRMLEEALGLPVKKMESGPLGGDMQIGAQIAESQIDFLIFFWDPLESQPHDPDVRALLRVAVVWNLPLACNEASADYMMASPLLEDEYVRKIPDYSNYKKRSSGLLSPFA